jgi:hypothetical protein
LAVLLKLSKVTVPLAILGGGATVAGAKGTGEFELQGRLGISVDVLTPGDLPAKFRDQALKEAVPV